MTNSKIKNGLIAISAALAMSAVTLGATLSPAQAHSVAPGTVQASQVVRG